MKEQEGERFVRYSKRGLLCCVLRVLASFLLEATLFFYPNGMGHCRPRCCGQVVLSGRLCGKGTTSPPTGVGLAESPRQARAEVLGRAV